MSTDFASSLTHGPQPVIIIDGEILAKLYERRTSMLNIQLKSDRGICGIAERDFGGVMGLELVLPPQDSRVTGALVAAK